MYSLHAEEQIKERKIEKVWVEEAVKSPNQIEKDGDKYYVIKKLNGITLKIVYVKQKYIKIITVYKL